MLEAGVVRVCAYVCVRVCVGGFSNGAHCETQQGARKTLSRALGNSAGKWGFALA